MSFADGMRWVCAGMALLLVFTCVYCIFYSRTWDQRLRFGSTCLIAVVIVTGQLANLGNDGNWRMPVLAVGGWRSTWSGLRCSCAAHRARALTCHRQRKAASSLAEWGRGGVLSRRPSKFQRSSAAWHYS